VTGTIRVGNIFDDIGDAAKEAKARLILMGTHGKKGIQHVIGSYALKVITNSSVPFIVVQADSDIAQFKNIILPLDLSKETKQKLRLAVDVAKYFHSMIHLIIPRIGDEFLQNQVVRNLTYAKKHLRENKVSFSANIADSGGAFANKVIDFAKEKEADLITILNHQEFNLFGDSDEQKMLTNKHQIPVMCMNPNDINKVTGSFFS